jgi:MYND finger
LADFCGFLDSVNGNNRRTLGNYKQLVAIIQPFPKEFDDITKSSVEIQLKKGGPVLIKGYITNGKTMDPNVANYAMLVSQSMEGMFWMRTMQASAVFGFCALLDHARICFDLGTSVDNEPLKLVSQTGHRPNDSDDFESLATRFSLTLQDGTEVARCHLSYRDGSYDPSMGPTVEMLAVHKNYRGKGLLPVLWYWVRCFLEENFTLECMSNDTTPGHAMVKATQLTGAIIDIKDGVYVTDKDFLYDCAGFSVRVQKDPLASFFTGGRPKDEEGVLYLPLLTRQKIAARSSSPLVPPSAIPWPQKKGQRSCDRCGVMGAGLARCSRCKLVHYCTRDCQTYDWAQGGHAGVCTPAPKP